MSQSLNQHVNQWWDLSYEIEKLDGKMTELREKQAGLEADRCLVEEDIHQVVEGRESMVFEVAADTYVVLAWQEYSEDFTITLLREIQ